MKNIKNILSIVLLTFLLWGCEDFLSVNPQSELTQEAYPTTAADALQSTNAVYATLRDWHYHSGGFPILDIMSDDAHKGSSPDDAANTVGPYDDFTHSPTQDGLDRWWNVLYEGIRRANIVVQEVPTIEMNENLKNRYLAEARFLRGLYYFDLVRAFGGVPLVTSPEPELQVPRASRDDTFAQIIADLEFAAETLPPKSEYGGDDLGRATRGAAQALLARVYLFRGDFAQAESYAMDVIDSGEYGLEPEFVDANGQDGEHGIESVFEIGAVATGSVEGNQYANTQGVRGTPNRGWGFNRPSIDLREAFAEGDPRESGTIIELGDVIDGIEILGDSSTPDEMTDEQGNVIQIESYNRKVWIPGTSTNTQFGHNRRLIRYADVLLMAAEALNENNQPVAALIYLNQVRERARQGNASILPDITETNKDALRDIILHERRVELALEGHRFWDLVRTGEAPDVLGPLGFTEGKHEVLPIPQSEIDLSQGTLTQNEEW
ncbi:RagB/SusD family nutrient uptake outer membrane protein [Gracilimonas mengyeensis]|uniref:Starch-binding associating with outer membrane n=1 Tax=Gracilimonas mengyeensis TaxID=1302730 RepID=A0A521BWD6_9BACT|nr:RagB/SusD family nutrient uptake outer membrane protein [Gracilimonas mengyeensis]SMO51385.1 Starch-binding associating with outer membrane [Gracilimonas mengyeensis]